MAFLLFFLAGAAGGVLGGMGMGGGTALIPLLTVVCGVEQAAAQGINLLSFVPMSAVALTVHARRGLVKREGIFAVILPALLSSLLSSLLAAVLPSRALRKMFGAFLVALSAVQFRAAYFEKNRQKSARIFSKGIDKRKNLW